MKIKSKCSGLGDFLRTNIMGRHILMVEVLSYLADDEAGVDHLWDSADIAEMHQLAAAMAREEREIFDAYGRKIIAAIPSCEPVAVSYGRDYALAGNVEAAADRVWKYFRGSTPAFFTPLDFGLGLGQMLDARSKMNDFVQSLARDLYVELRRRIILGDRAKTGHRAIDAYLDAEYEKAMYDLGIFDILSEFEQSLEASRKQSLAKYLNSVTA